MKTKRVLTILLALAVAWEFGCQAKVPNWPSDILSSLFVPVNARTDKYYTLQGTYQVIYTVPEAFPGSQYVKELVNNMSARGWRRLKEDFLNPGLKHSWARPGQVEMQFGSWVEGKDKRVYLWMEDWEDAKKNIVRYDIKYIAREDSKGRITLDKSATIIAIYIPGELRPDPAELATHVKEMQRKADEESAKERRRFMRSTGP